MPAEDDAALPMYSVDIATMGTHQVNVKCPLLLSKYGPSFVYIPQSAKWVYICAARDEPTDSTAFEAENLMVGYGRLYWLSLGFVGLWIEPQVEQWSESVKILEDIDRRYPQTAYYCLAVSLQNK